MCVLRCVPTRVSLAIAMRATETHSDGNDSQMFDLDMIIKIYLFYCCAVYVCVLVTFNNVSNPSEHSVYFLWFSNGEMLVLVLAYKRKHVWCDARHVSVFECVCTCVRRCCFGSFFTSARFHADAAHCLLSPNSKRKSNVLYEPHQTAYSVCWMLMLVLMHCESCVCDDSVCFAIGRPWRLAVWMDNVSAL